jgi:hypothetical protein
MTLDQLIHLGWQDAADYFCERGTRYSTSELRVQADIRLQTDNDPAAPALTTIGQRMECLDIVAGISQIPQQASRPGSCHIQLELVMPQWNTSILVLEPALEHDWSVFLQAKPVESVSFYPCM